MSDDEVEMCRIKAVWKVTAALNCLVLCGCGGGV